MDAICASKTLSTPFTGCCHPGQVIRVPISHGEGNYFADDATLDALRPATACSSLLRAERRHHAAANPNKQTQPNE